MSQFDEKFAKEIRAELCKYNYDFIQYKCNVVEWIKRAWEPLEQFKRDHKNDESFDDLSTYKKDYLNTKHESLILAGKAEMIRIFGFVVELHEISNALQVEKLAALILLKDSTK